MTPQAGQTPPLGPAAIAVHDDCNVMGNAIGRQAGFVQAFECG